MGNVEASMGQPDLTYEQYATCYNILSLVIASMGSCTVFFFMRMPFFHERYRTALCFTGIVTMIACYHYFRIFNSFVDSYQLKACEAGKDVVGGHSYICGYTASGVYYNDAYRYMDWLLTVPLLLIEIILVMGLPAAETTNKSLTLGASAAVMIVLGYPGEISGQFGTRWCFWVLAMIPFCYIVYTLVVGLAAAGDKQKPESAGMLIKQACWWTVISWCTYPIVYILPMLIGGPNGVLDASDVVGIQVGYSIADIISKCGVGILVYQIGLQKSYYAHMRGDPEYTLEDKTEASGAEMQTLVGS